ncbi:restriction endonuclease [Candidatus Pacearchaeota archaeon]|nr:restriction endonuclease [Candidatus Pacearchaeota archaeon]
MKMLNENRDRKGDKFEREMADMFNRIGFKTKTHIFTKKINGQNSEQDVLAEKGDLKILIQCKDYAKFPIEDLEEVIQDLVEDGQYLGVDRLVLAITGNSKITKFIDYTKEKGVYLWDENYWRKLQRIETNQELKQEIGKNLQLPGFFISERQMCLLISSARISEADKQKLLNEILIFRNEEELKDEIKHLELKEEVKSNLETQELEEIERLMNFYNFDYHHKSSVYKRIKGEINLSEDPKRILVFNDIKTDIDKIAIEIYGKNEGSKYLINVYERWVNGKISKKDRDKISEEIFTKLGVHKKSEIEAGVIDVGSQINAAEIKKKLIKLVVRIGIVAVVFIIIWRILF